LYPGRTMEKKVFKLIPNSLIVYYKINEFNCNLNTNYFINFILNESNTNETEESKEEKASRLSSTSNNDLLATRDSNFIKYKSGSGKISI
jgi:hypothetical protein